ncbi:hypothetical protein DUNSADRAFT_7003 [Dunaliella salina]|uniref:Encoded protein n=1 Tax=Dunaliella salina TaxID=3046 RepID=A0ABQ7FTL2_DUNSA|nr:hypothetical protein DUNSADRAFT_7003 [Dunaliella salina]|eukprot:KAF5825778.1 hypothetical protein DUNSADRAFT_7003 [Dunaliella salina]
MANSRPLWQSVDSGGMCGTRNFLEVGHLVRYNPILGKEPLDFTLSALLDMEKTCLILPTADNLFLLEQDSHVLAVDCSSPGHLLISVSDASVASSWIPGTLLVGDRSLGCIIDGKNVPFYRHVESVKRISEKSRTSELGIMSILVETHQASAEHCFKSADIRFRSIPVGHKEHPVYPNKTVYHEGLNSTHQGRKLLDPIRYNVEQEFEPLSYNYDENAGGAILSEIPVYPPLGVASLEEIRESLLEDEERKKGRKGDSSEESEIEANVGVSIACKDCYQSLTTGEASRVNGQGQISLPTC